MKVVVEGHRKDVTVEDINQILVVTARTFDFQHKDDQPVKSINRSAFARAWMDILDKLGEDLIQYTDAFPKDWDIRIED